MRLESDDDVRRVRAVWLGPKGYTFPFAARYISWGVGTSVVLGSMLVYWLLPLPFRTGPAVWLFCLDLFATYLLMTFVDSDQSVGSVVKTAVVELRLWRNDRRVGDGVCRPVLRYTRAVGRSRDD